MRSRTEIGATLRRVRHARGLSLANVAADTALSPSFISVVEAGKSDISFGRLIRLTGFYDISLFELMDGKGNSVDGPTMRQGGYRHISSPNEGITVSALTTAKNPDMQPLLLEYAPRASLDTYQIHQGEEFIFVLAGAIELDLEGAKPTVLYAGDSAYYLAERKHTFRNPSSDPARLLAVVSPPTL